MSCTYRMKPSGDAADSASSSMTHIESSVTVADVFRCQKENGFCEPEDCTEGALESCSYTVNSALILLLFPAD